MHDFTTDKILKLPHRVRVAWSAAIVEKVVLLYSSHFQNAFGLREGLRVGWRFAKGELVKSAEIKRLKTRLLNSITSAEKEGYSYEQLGMVECVLDEVIRGLGGDALAGVEMAAIAFACHQLYRQRLEVDDPAITEVYWEYLENIAFDTAKRTLKMIRRMEARGESIDESVVSKFEFGEVEPLKLLRKAKRAGQSRRMVPREEFKTEKGK